MHRLFSTFADGAPGAGLLLMRMAAAGALLLRAGAVLAAGPAVAVAAIHVLAAVVGILLLLGLWTPFVAVLGVVAGGWEAYANPGNAGFHILLAALCAALALLGPGAWSLDARLFGWKRVEIQDGKRRIGPPS